MSKTKTRSVAARPGNRGWEERRRRVLYLTGWNVEAVHDGIVAYAREAGWILDNSMCYTGRIPVRARPDGVICRHVYREDIIDFTRRLGVPAVGFEHDKRLPIPCVYYDHEAIGAMAARHLIERGFRTLCFLHMHFTPSQMPRMSGFRREAEAAGCSFQELCPAEKPASWHAPPGEDWEWLQQAVEQIDGPIGMMITNDQIARPAIDALLDMGQRIPARIAVVAAENDPRVCDIAGVPISSVETSTWRMGYEAARSLDRMLDNGNRPEQPRLVEPTHVHTRDSSDLLAVDNLYAAEALRYIWQHYHERIWVEDVAAAAPVTRRHLQNLFQKHVGRSMQDELARVRTARACRLLKISTLPMDEVARQAGFSNGLHLRRTFQSVLGTVPNTFRLSGEMPDLGILPVSVDA